MANLPNAIKQIRKDKKRTERNQPILADIKTAIKKAKKAIETGESNVDEMLKDIQKMLDKAVQKKIMKKNTAARKLSRLFALKKKNSKK